EPDARGHPYRFRSGRDGGAAARRTCERVRDSRAAPRAASRARAASMTWEDLDWSRLDRLRNLFLHGGVAEGAYWRDHDDLAHYDFTYAARIGWKWDAVIGELQRRRWQPPTGCVLDWGCGSGVAGRRVVAAWPDAVTGLRVWDQSAVAREFAASKARNAFPTLDVAELA